MSNERGVRKRTDYQILADQEFIVDLMKDSSGMQIMDIHRLLNEHIADREKENAYTLSYPMVAKMVTHIKQGYVKHAGVNVQQEILETNDRYEYLIAIAADELARRLQDRERIIVTTTDLVYADISHLNEAQIEVLKSIDLEVSKRKTTTEKIHGGTGIESLLSNLDSLLKSKRLLFGLDAPKKVEKKITKSHMFQAFDKQQLIDLFNKLKLPTGPLINYLETTFKNPKQLGEQAQEDNGPRE